MASKSPAPNPFADMDALLSKSANTKLTSNKPPVAAATGTSSSTSSSSSSTVSSAKKQPIPDFNIFEPVKPKSTATSLAATGKSTANSNSNAKLDFDLFEPPKLKNSTLTSPTRPALTTTASGSNSKSPSIPLDIFSVPTIGIHKDKTESESTLANPPASKPPVVPIDNASLDFLLGMGAKPTSTSTNVNAKTAKATSGGGHTAAVKNATSVTPNFVDIIHVAAVPVTNYSDADDAVEISQDMIMTNVQQTNQLKKKPAAAANSTMQFDLLGDDLLDSSISSAPPPVPKVRSGSDFDFDIMPTTKGGTSSQAAAASSNFNMFGDEETDLRSKPATKVKGSKATKASSNFDMFGDDEASATSNFEMQRQQTKANATTTAKASNFDMFGDDAEDDADTAATYSKHKSGGGKTIKAATATVVSSQHHHASTSKGSNQQFDMFSDDNTDNSLETDFEDPVAKKNKSVQQFDDNDEDDDFEEQVASNHRSTAKVGGKARVPESNDDDDDFDESFDDINRNNKSNNSKSKSKSSSSADTSSGSGGGGFGKTKSGGGGGGARDSLNSNSNQPAKKSFTKADETSGNKEEGEKEEGEDQNPNLSPKYPVEGEILYRKAKQSLGGIFLTKQWTVFYYVFEDDKLMLFDTKDDYERSKGRNYKKCYPIVYNLKVNKPRSKQYGHEQIFNFMMEEIRDYGPVNICKFASPDKTEVEDFFNQMVYVINRKRAEYKAKQAIKR